MNRRFQFLLTLGLPLFALACSSSKEKTGVSTEHGTVAGYVEQIFHHGAYNPDGPNKTISRMPNVYVIVVDTTGTTIDTLTTDAKGEFSQSFPPGRYTFGIPAQEIEGVAGGAPEPESVIVTPGSSAEIVLQFRVFAP